MLILNISKVLLVKGMLIIRIIIIRITICLHGVMQDQKTQFVIQVHEGTIVMIRIAVDMMEGRMSFMRITVILVEVIRFEDHLLRILLDNFHHVKWVDSHGIWIVTYSWKHPNEDRRKTIDGTTLKKVTSCLMT